MTRAAVCGTVFDAAVSVLGLERVRSDPDVVLVDLADPLAVASASAFDARVPRVAVGGPDHDVLIRALGIDLVLAPGPAPAAIGPILSRALPLPARRATRVVVVTGTRGGVGRTLLVASVGTRLAQRCSVFVLDLTGSGAVAWWLGLAPAGWPELEGLAQEMTGEHLAVVAAEAGRLRLIGAASPMPSVDLASAAVRAAATLADIVIVDAPTLMDDRTRALLDLADRVLVLAADDAVSAAAASALPADERTWIIASRCRSAASRAVRALPEDPASVRSASRGPSAVGGALGRAYDDLAELLAIDTE